MSKYLLILGIGHVLGDYYFQTDKMAKEKDEYFAGVVKHSLAYTAGILIAILPVINFGLAKWAAVYTLSHFAIDAAKFGLLKTGKVKKSANLFIADQCAHMICIFVTAYILYASRCGLSEFALISSIQQALGISKERIARWLLAIMVINKPVNIFIQVVLAEMKPEAAAGSNAAVDRNTGKWIGSIERLIMLLLMAMGQYTAMGLVLLAKTIAGYDRIAKDRVFGERYLVGTLLSTASVVVCKVVLGV